LPKTEPRYLTPDQVERLARVIDPRFGALVYAGAFLGLRWSELARLKRAKIDLHSRRLLAVGALQRVKNTWNKQHPQIAFIPAIKCRY
jgi:integrase